MIFKRKYCLLLYLLLFIAIVLIAGIGCEDHLPPQPYVPTINLSVEDFGTTYVDLKLKVVDCSVPVQIEVKRDDRIIFSQQRTSIDTILYDTRLSFNHAYRYTAIKEASSWMQESTYVDVRTTDTTSHAFNWQILTFGDGLGNYFNDVAIINDTCVWAVGEIYKVDSTNE
jgi:hypothetical protein